MARYLITRIRKLHATSNIEVLSTSTVSNRVAADEEFDRMYKFIQPGETVKLQDLKRDAGKDVVRQEHKNTAAEDRDEVLQHAEFRIRCAEGEVEYTRNKLVEAAERLERNMHRVVEHIKSNPDTASINSLGEVQGYGADVDRRCVEYTEKLKQLESLKGFHKELVKLDTLRDKMVENKTPGGCTCGEAYGTRSKDQPKCSYCA